LTIDGHIAMTAESRSDWPVDQHVTVTMATTLTLSVVVAEGAA